jgi:hypothetical protein
MVLEIKPRTLVVLFKCSIIDLHPQPSKSFLFKRFTSVSHFVYKVKWDYCFLFFFFCGAGAWTQGLHLEPLYQPFLCEGFFEIGSLKLCAWAGFKSRSSWFLPPE